MKAQEANFDGLVGPTHSYSGLSFGNVASQSNAASVANPRSAAKQGLRKMKALATGFYRVRPPNYCAGRGTGAGITGRRELGFGDVGGECSDHQPIIRYARCSGALYTG